MSSHASIKGQGTPRLTAALKGWKTRGAPVGNESYGDSAAVSDSNSDSGPDADLYNGHATGTRSARLTWSLSAAMSFASSD